MTWAKHSVPGPREWVVRTFYRCGECGLASHVAVDVEDPPETADDECSLCRTRTERELVNVRVVKLKPNRVRDEDTVVASPEAFFSGGDATA